MPTWCGAPEAGAHEDEIAGDERARRLGCCEVPQVGRGRAARQREAGGGVGVVDQPGAVEPALGAALASPDVGPAHLRLGSRDRRERATGAVQVDRPERAGRQRRRVA